MILLTPCALQLLDLGGDRRDVVLDRDVRAGRGDLRRVGRHRADDADLLAADVEHQRRLDAVADLGLRARLDVGAEHRELDHRRGTAPARPRRRRTRGCRRSWRRTSSGSGTRLPPRPCRSCRTASPGNCRRRSAAARSGLRASCARAAIAVTSRAAPPMHSPLPSSSAEQVDSNLLFDSMRLCQSLMCRMVNV